CRTARPRARVQPRPYRCACTRYTGAGPIDRADLSVVAPTIFQATVVSVSTSNRTHVPSISSPAISPTFTRASLIHLGSSPRADLANASSMNTLSSHACTAVPIEGSHGTGPGSWVVPASLCPRHRSHGVPISDGPILVCSDRGELV